MLFETIQYYFNEISCDSRESSGIPWNSLNPNNASNKRFVLCTYTLRHNRTPHQTDVKEMDILHELPVAIQPSNAPRISAFRCEKLRRFITEATDEVKEKMSEKLREVYYWIPLGIPIAALLLCLVFHGPFGQ